MGEAAELDEGVLSPWRAYILAFAFVFYIVLSLGKVPPSKAEKARQYKDSYEKIRNEQEVSGGYHKSESSLEISELWIYPVKSLRGIRVPSALITSEGFYLDRRYMLLRVGDENPPQPKSMHISHHPEMGLFQASIPSESKDIFRITHRDPASHALDTLDLPFEPPASALAALSRVTVDMYGSACSAYDMGAPYNDWFSAHFHFPVILAFWGGNARPVLGNLPGRPADEAPSPKSLARQTLEAIPVLGPLLLATTRDVTIAFNDMASFLVISEASLRDVSRRIETPVDPSKFRANIIVVGAADAFAEDYWGELTIKSGDPLEWDTKIALTANCVRCASLNVDYETGKPARGKEGEVLKLLQKDRRVDSGMKYSPVFGRYGFPGKGDDGKVLRVGDEVVVSRVNGERTKFGWHFTSS